MSSIRLGRLGLLFVALLGLLSLFSASAFAAEKPIVTSSSASNLKLNGATFNGTVNPNGASTTYKFEWGETTAYGKSTTTTNVGSGSSAVPVSASLLGLEPGKTYHYRVSATNSFGTVVSGDVQFQTPQWRVEGKPVYEYPENSPYKMSFQTKSFETTMVGEGMTKSGIAVKVTCAVNNGGDLAWGDLATFYHFPFTGCKTALNGSETKKCAAASYTELKLNVSLAATVGKTIFLGETCPIGEELVFGNGFEISLGSASEVLQPEVTITGKATNIPITFTIKDTWALNSSAYKGLKFGVS